MNAYSHAGVDSVDKLVLVVDDDPWITAVFRRVLVGVGCQCIAVNSAEGALETMLHAKVDVLITDLNMPDMDGLELIRRTRQELGVSGPRVVVVSASSHQLTRQEMDEYQISHVLSKPVDEISTLARIVGELLG